MIRCMNQNLQQLLMILQPDHKHQQQHHSLQIINPIPVEAPKPQKKEEAAGPPPILSHLLSNSIQLLNQKSTNQIKGMLKYSEAKILLTFSDDPNNYLNHLMSKSQGQGNQSILKQIINLQNDLFVDKIEMGEEELHQKANFKHLKASLSNKITDMKRSIMSLSSIQRKANKQVQQNLMEFRRKSYWNVPSEKNQQLKSFLSKMKRIYSENKRNYKKSYKEMQMRSKKEMEQQLKQKESLKKEMFSKQLQKQTLWRKERLKYSQEQKKKRQEIQNLLKKFNPDQRIYQRKQEQFIKNVIEPMEEERQKKLDERKEKYQPLDHDELEEHLQKYQEYKESLLDEYSKKKEEEKEMNTKLEQELKELYHGKFHQVLSSPRFYNSVKVQKESIRKKLKEYTTQIRRHKPNIDNQKRAQMKEIKRNLYLAKNKNKQKIVLQDGTVVIKNKPEIDPRKLGVQYLQKLKEENEGKPRKKEQNSSSLVELQNKTKFRKIDYLRQNKPNIKLKQSMGDWKKVISDQTYSPRQKYASIMEQVNVMEEKAKRKQQEMRSYKKGDKSLELKQQMDRFYMQSVAAKMVVLKDIILKE